jgi:hypothetical protein
MVFSGIVPATATVDDPGAVAHSESIVGLTSQWNSK